MAKDIQNDSPQWIWQRPDWPYFEYDVSRLKNFLDTFDQNNLLSINQIIMFERSDTNEFIVAIKVRNYMGFDLRTSFY
jgi:hypothetical protein